MNRLSRRSRENLKGLDPRLAALVGYVLARGREDFTITCGIRSADEQRELYQRGLSKFDGYVKKSKHQTGEAIDFIPYPFFGDWDNIDSFERVIEEFRKASELLGIEIYFGGDWVSFKDYAHIQLK